MEKDYNNGYLPFMDFGMMSPNTNDITDVYKDPMLNPIMQYEQAYSYYKYLCMQMDYKIKCKEYEKLCKNIPNVNEKKEIR